MNYIIDTAARQITLLDARFYHTEDGDFVPSVTTILEAYPKDAAFYQWLKNNGQDSDELRDKAAERGTNVHKLTEAYDNGEEVSLLNADGRPQFKISEWAMFERYVEFVTRFTPKILATEQNYVSADLGYAGTIDRVMEIRGQKLLVDIKTSGSIWPAYWLQLAAYRNLLLDCADIEVDGVAILHLNAKTRTNGKKDDIQGPGWQMVIRTDTDKELDLFTITRRLWLTQHEGELPRQASYKTEHKKA
jgi:hypothetical protein